jgi:ADP-L-glycero-D-manno-heptose 6-epimerase
MTLDPILVTGAAGFIGARFVESCNARHARVIAVDDLAAFDSRPEHLGLDFGERVDRRELETGLADGSVEPAAIVHLGACTDTTEMNEEFLREVNLDYSRMLWRHATERRLPFVYASSAATYGDGTRGWDDEESGMAALEPLNPYGESKLQFDLWALEEEREGRCPPAWSGFKFFNVYGFGERHKGKMSSVVIQAFDQIREHGRVRLFKSHRDDVAHGHQSRDFIYVDDVVAVLWFAMEKPIRRGIFNLGTGRARTFLDLARAVFRALGRDDDVEFVDTPEHLRPRYQYFTEANMAKLRAEGYGRTFTSLEDGVRAYVERLLAYENAARSD